jgi:hypothetical protein
MTERTTMAVRSNQRGRDESGGVMACRSRPQGVAREAERQDRQQEATERLHRHAAHRALLGGVAGEVAAGETRSEDPEDGVERPLGEQPRPSGAVDDAFPAGGGPPCSAHQGVT